MLLISFITCIVTVVKGAHITSNIDDNVACPGEELILTCTSEGAFQRWSKAEDNHSLDIIILFTRQDQPGRQTIMGLFTGTLISVDYDHNNIIVVSNLSTVISNEINNITVTCSSQTSSATTTIRIKG